MGISSKILFSIVGVFAAVLLADTQGAAAGTATMTMTTTPPPTIAPTPLPAWNQQQYSAERISLQSNDPFFIPTVSTTTTPGPKLEQIPMEASQDAVQLGGPVIWENAAYVGTSSGKIFAFDLPNKSVSVHG